MMVIHERFSLIFPLSPQGFKHSSFTFGNESQVNRVSVNGKEVPPGALISFLQKGIQYMEVEAKLKNKVCQNHVLSCELLI